SNHSRHDDGRDTRIVGYLVISYALDPIHPFFRQFVRFGYRLFNLLNRSLEGSSKVIIIGHGSSSLLASTVDWHWPGQPPQGTLRRDTNSKASQHVCEPVGQQDDSRANKNCA